MQRLALAFSLLFLLLIAACAGVRSSNPTSPQLPDSKLTSQALQTIDTDRSLLGFYRVAIDPVSSTANVIPLREATWHLNALKFLEPPAGGSLVSFSHMSIVGRQVDVDVTIKHPFPGMPYYVGFDVKGIVIGPADRTDSTDLSRSWAGGPDGLRLLNADGWTRWWNPVEFPNNQTVFSYMDGVAGTQFAVAKYNATLLGYKVFASVLDKDDPIAKLLSVPVVGHPYGRATFRSSSIATRHYKLVFPGNASGGPDLVFNYAIDACHGFPDNYNVGDNIDVPDAFPASANQPEPFILDANVKSNTLYLLPGGCMGGVLDFDIRVSDWQALLAGTPVSKQVKSIELTSPSLFVGARIPALISDSTPAAPWATWHITLDGLIPDSSLDQQILVTVTSSEGDYRPDITSYNGTSQLAAYYVIRIPISTTGPIAEGGFSINSHSSWPKTGVDNRNTNRSTAYGPDKPEKAWEIAGLSYTVKPVVDPQGRVFLTSELEKGGVSLQVVNSGGFPTAKIDLPDFEPGGDPILAGCSLLWSDSNGQVIRVYTDGTHELVYQAAPVIKPSVFGVLNLDNMGRAFVHGPSGVQAFNEHGEMLWSVPSGLGGMTMFVGPSSVGSKGTLIVGEIELIDTSTYDFHLKGFSATSGNLLWVSNPSTQHIMAFGSSVDPAQGQIYITLGNKLTAVSSDGIERWLYATAKDLSPNIAIGPDESVYVGEIGSGSSSEDKDYRLVSVDPLGVKKWTFECTAPIVAGPIVDAGGLIYIATRDADVYCVNPDGTQKWFKDIGGRATYLSFGPSESLLLGIVQPQFTTSVVCLADSD